METIRQHGGFLICNNNFVLDLFIYAPSTGYAILIYQKDVTFIIRECQSRSRTFEHGVDPKPHFTTSPPSLRAFASTNTSYITVKSDFPL